MSDSITPIQRDAIGATTFEKVQNIEVSEPSKGAPKAPTSSSSDCSTPKDDLNFSGPMKKYMIQKKSYFTAPPPPAEKQKDRTKEANHNPQDPLNEAYQKYSMTTSQAGNILSILG